MTPQIRARIRLVPFAAALALALPSAARAQAAPAPAPAAGQQLKDLPLDAAARQQYVGTYVFTASDGDRGTIRIYEEQGRLIGHPEGDDSPSRLLYQGEHTFHPEVAPEFRLVFTVQDGRAVKFTGRRGNLVIEATRAADGAGS